MKHLLSLTLALFLASSLGAQSFWTPISDQDISLKAGLEREIIPVSYATFELDEAGLKKALSAAPHEMSKQRSAQEVELTIPMPDGSVSTFYVYEAPVMAEKISARFSNIKSYKGYNVADRSQLIRLDLGEYGFHASIHTMLGAIYIDPYAKGDTKHYISYWTEDHLVEWDADVPLCGAGNHDLSGLNPSEGHTISTRSPVGEPVQLRTYRAAIAGTYDWSRRRGTVEACISDINTSLNRLNLIYETEAGIRMVLINNNESIIFLNESTEPYINPDQGRLLIGENTTVINSRIGSGAYDIGHVYAICNDVGGIAALGSVCRGNKGNAVTCANSSNVVAWTVNITSHEMGHQFSANHSFNNCRNNGNENNATGYEPGSGTTIMSYAGLCGSNNVQGYNDDYFHVGSLTEIYSHSRFGNAGDCADKTETSNTAPMVSIPLEDGFTIPIGTPFELRGEATDAEGDPMTFNWEQRNSGPISSYGSPIGNAPIFRSLYPDTSKTRTIPILRRLLNNTTSQDEILPSTNRDITMVFVARDNNMEAGTASWAEIDFKATASAGPFLVQYPNTFTQITVGDVIEVQWDVANTVAEPVGATHVDILLSTDGGYTYPVTLAEATANDGVESIVIPNAITDMARIKIRPTNNIFFDISNNNFEIAAPSEATFIMEHVSRSQDICLPDNAVYEITTTAFLDYAESIDLSVANGLPAGAVATFEPATITAGEPTTLTLDLSEASGTADYTVEIKAVAGDGQEIIRELFLSTTGTDFSLLTLNEPTNGLTGSEQLPAFEWTAVEDAVEYELEVATNPSFDEASIVFSLVTDDVSATSTSILPVGQVFYWRVKGFNKCNAEKEMGYSPIYAFTTASLACKTYSASNMPLAISSSGGVSRDAEIQVSESGKLADINVLKMSGDHTRGGDLIGTLISPSGTEVQLWKNICVTQQNFNLGLDDQAPAPIGCPINNGRVMRPKQPLSALEGEEINGTWLLQIRDNRSGNGGTYEEASLEICGNISLAPPVLVNNEVLSVVLGENKVINNSELLAEDSNNTANELTYTVVRVPEHGHLRLNGVRMEVGTQFTQAQLNNKEVRYKQERADESSATDQFTFTVVDPDGGWISMTDFDIAIDLNATGVKNVELEDALALYPNPASSILNVQADLPEWQSAGVQLLNLKGQVILQSRLATGKARLDVSDVAPGLYLVAVRSAEGQDVRKVIIGR